MDSHWCFPSRYLQKTAPSRKVVSIPVQFVGSGGRSRSDSAVKIQKAFRGFLVRRSVRKIAEIRREVEVMERKISEESTVDLIRIDPKERLRVNEALMSLLFRLDSVRGVDSAVRDCRKAVIRRAIVLQEMVDAIVAGVGERTIGSTGGDASEAGKEIAGAVDQTLEAPKADDGELRGKASETEISAADLVDNCCDAHENWGSLEELETHVVDSKPNSVESMPNLSEANDKHCENSEKVDLGGVGEVGIETKANGSEENAESVGMSQSESGSSADPDSLVEGVEENSTKQEEEGMEIVGPERKEEVGGAAGREESKRDNEVLERMMEDNERMMGLMTELLEKNEMQTRLLSSLSHRVEQLERAFMCDKLRRKKKKRHAFGAVDGLEKLPDTRKR
ncbi:hypothetical protein FH972_009398 [Carpinus fangiana]|uniref:BAG domain-containing protein n=1 Tax=Carpinus fangiana TaxID=176857 RepID=A0A5N6R3C9_9ROSI|nr:hypothetical protein FH972_009398 [Carpinus fangiana]